MSNKDVQALFDHVVHIGHRSQKWNPKMKKYLYGEKGGIHIINLEKTLDCLNKALDFLSKVTAEGKIVLFVSTKPQSLKVVEDVATSVSMPYVVSRWIPGLLTNFSTLKTRIKYLQNLKEQEASGEFDKYTKKEASNLKKTIEKLQLSLGGVSNMMDLPDVVFVVDVVRDKIAVEEARKIKIPVVALVDSNADPNMVDYPIPANDDALKSLIYMLGKVGECLHKSRNKR
ncbi:30S ribosomal protein S2 [Candidatus Peregrinibacteria bacterium]|nr:30S ribosomal protein S2 [Candidatus Peregrinibacteria bacterium]